MNSLQEKYPFVMEKYYEVIHSIDAEIGKCFDVQTREILLVAIGAAIGNENVVRFHAKRAMDNGASDAQLSCAALMPLPIVGQTNCRKSLDIIREVAESGD
ncbi:MAG: hypothetical protein GF311_27970 [Candidatus Lokiarchaeota archaeon]|nr:hypothetical protein [Candidatus Lokiarchaeota archaeon]MBD3239295.1 hypothetical protein [Chitinivibrionales bacterium]